MTTEATVLSPIIDYPNFSIWPTSSPVEFVLDLKGTREDRNAIDSDPAFAVRLANAMRVLRVHLGLGSSTLIHLVPSQGYDALAGTGFPTVTVISVYLMTVQPGLIAVADLPITSVGLIDMAGQLEVSQELRETLAIVAGRHSQQLSAGRTLGDLAAVGQRELRDACRVTVGKERFELIAAFFSRWSIPFPER